MQYAYFVMQKRHMQLPFRHTKHSSSSMKRKKYICRDHFNCDHTFTVYEGDNKENIESYLCYESGSHRTDLPESTIIVAPIRGIHPAIKIKIDEWIKDGNMKPSKILFRLQNSDFLQTHELPSIQRIRQHKSDIAKCAGKNLNTLSSFRHYINEYKVRIYFIVILYYRPQKF